MRTIALLLLLLPGCGVYYSVSVPEQAEFDAMSEPELYEGLFKASGDRARAFRLEIVRRHPEWPKETKDAVQAQQALIGMTKDQFLASWGRPRDVNRTLGRGGSHEQWLYGYGPVRYIYFENDTLITIQD